MCETSDERLYYIRTSLMYTDLTRELLFKVFKYLIKRENITDFLSSPEQQTKLKELSKRNLLNKCDYNLVSGQVLNLERFDISLLIRLILNLCKNETPKPQLGWETKPSPKDESLGADLLRLRNVRNKIIGHRADAKLSEAEYKHVWAKVKAILLRVIEQVDKDSRGDFEQRLNEYQQLNIDAEKSKVQRLLNELLQYKKEIDFLQEKVEELIKRSQEFKTYFKTTPERFIRYIKLLFDGGRLVLCGILDRELGEQDLLDFLERNKDNLMKNIEEKYLRCLYPQEPISVNHKMWDVLLLALLLLLMFDDGLSQKEIRNINIIKTARLNYADLALQSLDTDDFLTQWTDLINCLNQLSVNIAEDDQHKVECLIERNKRKDDKGCNAEEYFKQLKESGVEVKTLTDVYNEITSQLKDTLRELSQKGIKFQQDHVMELKLQTTCENEEIRKKADDLLESGFQASINGSDHPSNLIRLEADKIVTRLTAHPDVTPGEVKQKCILISLKCSTPCGLLHILDYTTSNQFQRSLLNIANELHYMQGIVFHLQGNLTLESVSRVTKIIGQETGTAFKAPREETNIPLKCSSIDGLRSVLSAIKQEKTTNSLNKIAEQISAELKETVTLNIVPDLMEFQSFLDETDSDESGSFCKNEDEEEILHGAIAGNEIDSEHTNFNPRTASTESNKSKTRSEHTVDKTKETTIHEHADKEADSSHLKAVLADEKLSENILALKSENVCHICQPRNKHPDQRWKMAGRGARLVSGADLENLPSFGMSSYVNIASGVETMKMIKNIGAGKFPQQKFLTGVQQSSSVLGQSSVDPPTTSSTSNGDHIQVVIQDDTENEQDPNESATAPIASTVDASQIMETETSSSTKDSGVNARPELKVKMMTDYMRFRYMSEKCPAKKKGTKTRQYETEDMDKHCLAEVSVDNYDGAGKIVAYCVDATGKLHPYNLFGDQCNRGVYVVRFRFRQGKVARLYKVSVTTPKAKEYKENLKNQLSYLTEVGIQDIKFCTPEEIQDKQIVYVMFRVILDNGDILTKISTALQNKKKGKEFKIEDVEPVCCPANMPVDCVNPWKHRIMLHVTEGTAFPSDVGLKIRERDSNKKIVWETEPVTFHTIKQCVVKFVPPPYRDPETKKDVEVEICLYDKATKNETEPFKFIYKGLENVKPEMNFDHKAKKRKLMDDIDMASTSFSPDVRGERKTLTALRSRPNSTSSGSSNGSSAENSLTYQESQPSFESAQNRSATPTGVEEGAVSIRENQQGNGQIPFQNYSGQNPGQSVFGASNGQSSRSQSAGFRGQMSGTGVQASSNETSIVTSTTSVFCTTTTATTSYVSPELPTMSVNSSRENTASNNQIQPEATEQHPGVMVLSEEDKYSFEEQGIELPKLGPNQMYALIGGQIYVVNDDTAEQSSNVTQTPAPYNSPATSTVTQTPAPYNSQANVQNIGQLQVVIQQFAPQQPASEAEQRQVTFPPSMVQQTQMSSGTSQSMGAQNFPLSTASMSTAVDQSAVLQQQQNVLMQQQQQEQLLQQQQLQQVQQVLQQPDVYQQLVQVAIQAGLDHTNPVVLQQLLQQISALQGQTSLQQENAAEATMFGAGADLNDDDLEEDGGSVNTKNASKNKTNKPMSVVKAGDRRNKKLRGSSGIGKVMYEAEQMEYVEGEIDDDTRIPVFVNEVTIGEESNDCDTNNKVQSVKTVQYKMKNGSFGNDISSDEDESR